MKRSSFCILPVCFIFFLLVISTHSWSMAPPDPSMIKKYKQDGSYKDRQEFAEKLGNHLVHPDLIKRHKLIQEFVKSGGDLKSATFPYSTGLPSTGSPSVFALLIDFPDHPHQNDASVFENKLFGYGDANAKPYESLMSYYNRSSYGLLNIQGDVMAWYRASKNRSEYPDSMTIIKEALAALEPLHDFSVYDQNNGGAGDGKIDFFMVFWSGPDTGWGSLWWAWCDIYGENFANDPFTVDGKTLGVYCWQWEGSNFSPHTVIHETGHALGLPDLYDYDDNENDGLIEGPPGGVGGLDMMDANKGDHNCFSKWLLGWSDPVVIGDINHLHTEYLRPASLFPDSIAIMPGLSESNAFGEFFMVQNRSPITGENDQYYSTDGLVIWHINSKLNATNDGFLYNNSHTGYKLVRLMEADGKEEIEQKQPSDKGDIYRSNQQFTPLSKPDSNKYSGVRSGVSVINIVPTGIGSFYKAQFVNSTSDPISIGIAVDNVLQDWNYDPIAPWFGQQATAYTHNSSAQSGPIADDGQSWLLTKVTGPGRLSFYWKVSSEEDGDYLEFSIDNLLVDQVSGKSDWVYYGVDIEAGEHELRWTYRKNSSISEGDDCGWLDHVVYYQDSLADAVENFKLSWITHGVNEWGRVEDAAYYAGDAASVPAGTEIEEQSALETCVVGPGKLTFLWNEIESTDLADLSLNIDDDFKKILIGSGWKEEEIDIESGIHKISWVYENWVDGSGINNGLLDHVRYSQSGITLGQAVDNESYTYITYGTSASANWFGQDAVSIYGFDAAQSGPVLDNQQSIMETTVMGPATLTFNWKTSSHTNDRLEFVLDGYGQKNIGGISLSWGEETYLLGPGSHVLGWIYYKDGSGSSGSDCGWVDNIRVEVAPSLGEAVDNTSLTWETGGDAAWTGQRLTSIFDGDAAVSGDITHNQESYIYTTVAGPGTLKFQWKVSSQSWDKLEFLIDDGEIESIGGQIDWEEKEFFIGAGNHEVKWRYVKDNAFTDPQDRAWLDHVIFNSGNYFLLH